jgi:glutathione peroxidase
MKKNRTLIAASIATLALGSSLGFATIDSPASETPAPPDSAPASPPSSPPAAPSSPNADSVPPALDFTMKSIKGEDVHLAEEYAGKVVLIVNVASRCGYTKQYEGLQNLHETYHEQGLAVLGFPANDFGAQEPGTNEEILEFCTERYEVEFPMFAKVSVKGEEICPLYKRLTDPEQTPKSEGEIKWNFEKFLLDREGNVVKHYRSKTTPEEIATDIEALLEKKDG